MSKKIEIPVFVSIKHKAEGRRYRISCLFYPSIYGEGKTFDRGLRNCAKELRKSINQTRYNSDNIEDLLWITFNPELHTETINIFLRLGKTEQFLDILRTRFTIDQYTYIYFPTVFTQFIMIPAKTRGKERNLLI